MSVIHLTSRYNPPDIDTARRQKVAMQSWFKQPWREYPVDQLPRWWREEGRALPFLRDLFDAGCLGRDPQDIIVYTNADILVRSDATLLITTHLQRAHSCYAYRMDFARHINAPIADRDFAKGTLYPGSDLVAFRVSWWSKYRELAPDMVLGREATDPVLRTLIDETNKPTAPNEIIGIIAHERHGGAGHWEASENRYRLKSQLHNLSLAKEFFTQRGVNPAQFGIRGV